MNKNKQPKLPLSLPKHRRPKVLLLGNGMNRIYGGASWAGLLAQINRTNFTAEQVKSMPFPMQAVLLSNDHVDASLKDLSRELSRGETHPWLDAQLKKLLSLPFDCILTSNFTYEIESAADPKFLYVHSRANRYRKHTPAVKRAETRFMLHTYYDLPFAEKTVPVFHIHGEAKKPDSVILGHYYYGNLLFHYDAYLSKHAPERRYLTPRGKSDITVHSWLDYFILGDVYTLGFGYDTSEMDLWWLLCRKKRERTNHGSLYFFEPFRQSTLTKIALLEAYEAKFLSLGVEEPSPEAYQSFYEKAIDEIASRLLNDT